MQINVTTKLDIGTKLYYLTGQGIKETEVTGIKIDSHFGKHFGMPVMGDIWYAIPGETHFVKEEDVFKKFSLNKTDIVKKLMDTL